MRLRITFSIDTETRMAVARHYDLKNYDGHRLATRDEIEGVIMDGAENSLDMVVNDYRIWLENEGGTRRHE